MKERGVSRHSFLVASAIADFFVPASKVLGQAVKDAPGLYQGTDHLGLRRGIETVIKF